VKEQCLVLFPYTAQNEDELSLEEGQLITIITRYLLSSFADSDPDPDPHVFGPPGSGSIGQRYLDPSIIKPI
jgi:hypothetical protein